MPTCLGPAPLPHSAVRWERLVLVIVLVFLLLLVLVLVVVLVVSLLPCNFSSTRLGGMRGAIE